MSKRPDRPDGGEPDESGAHTDATGFWLPEERRRVDGAPADEPWDDPTKALDASARAYPREPAPGPEFDGVPTQAFAPDEPPTTQVDLARLEALAPTAPLPEAHAPSEPDYEGAEADGYRGWGPQVPDEMVKTTFFDRGGAKDDPEAWKEPAVDTAPAVRKPPDRGSGRSMLTRTFVAPGGGVRRGRAVVIAALCIAGGVIIGTAIGLGASGGEAPAPVRTDAVPEPREPAEPAVEVEPEVAPEPLAEARPAPEPAPEVEPEPQVEPEPEPEPVVEATPDPEPAAPEGDPLEDAAVALRRAEVDAAADALERARARGAEPAALARVEAELAVLRGDGALAVARLRELAEAHRESSIYAALGRALVQAERDREANDAFRRALELDESDVDAHLGVAGVHARGARIGAARRSHRQALDAAGPRASADPLLGARVRATEALILLENGDMSGATREAEAARRLDERSSEAALVLARIALLRSQPADAHLRSAVEGRAPAPMALALLAQAVEGQEACRLASRYLERAPQGFDAPAMRRIRQRCR